MYEYLYGKPVARDAAGYLILAVGDVGYRVRSLGRDWELVADADAACQILIRAVFSESNGYTLFGFFHQADRVAFDLLTRTKGIGGGKAMDILEQLLPHELGQILREKDDKALAKLKGLGGRTAVTIIAELHDKADQLPGGKSDEDSRSLRPEYRIVIDALVSLGFTRNKAVTVVTKLTRAQPDMVHDALLRQSIAELQG